MKHEIAFDNHENGMKVAQMLLEEHYVVMLSYEENLLIVNYEYSEYTDRNDVVFMRLDEYDEDMDNFAEQVYEDVISDMYEDILYRGKDMNKVIRELGAKFENKTL